MSKQVSLLKRGISYIVDLYSGSLIGTLPISLMTYVQLGKMTQNAFLLEKFTALNCKMKLELRNWDKGACPFIPIRAAAGPLFSIFVKKSP